MSEWFLRREIARRARIEGTFLPTSDPGLHERWGRVIVAEPCPQTTLFYGQMRMAHFGPLYDTEPLVAALTTLASMRAGRAPYA